MEQYKCESCGAVLESKSNHCPYCGAVLDGAAVGNGNAQGTFETPVSPICPQNTPVKKKQSFLAMLIGGIILCAFALFMLIGFVSSDIVTPSVFSEHSHTELQDGEYIVFDDLVIVDIAAEETEETSGIKTERTTAHLVICCAEDKDGTVVSLPLYVSAEHGELTASILEYRNDETAYIGDLRVKAAVKATEFSAYAAGAEAAYNESYAVYKADLGSVPFGTCFEYVGETADELVEMQKSGRNSMLYVGCAFAVLGGLLVFLYFFLKKKAAANEAAMAAQYSL